MPNSNHGRDTGWICEAGHGERIPDGCECPQGAASIDPVHQRHWPLQQCAPGVRNRCLASQIGSRLGER
jgi:hypothetical protein